MNNPKILDINFVGDCKLSDLPAGSWIKLYKNNGSLIDIDYQIDCCCNKVETKDDKILISNCNTLNSRYIHKNKIVRCEQINQDVAIHFKNLNN